MKLCATIMIIFLKKKIKHFKTLAYILGKCFIVRKEETEMEINSFVALITNVGFVRYVAN